MVLRLYQLDLHKQCLYTYASLAVLQKAEEVAADVPEVVDPTMLSQDMLRKYITFAKQNCRPRLANADVEKIGQVN